MNIPRFLALKPSHLLRLIFSINNIIFIYIFITLEGFYMALALRSGLSIGVVASLLWRFLMWRAAAKAAAQAAAKAAAQPREEDPEKKRLREHLGLQVFMGRGGWLSFWCWGREKEREQSN